MPKCTKHRRKRVGMPLVVGLSRGTNTRPSNICRNMIFLMYWHFVLLFVVDAISDDVGSDSSRRRKLFDPTVKTHFYITGSQCSSSLCRIDYSSLNCCDNLKNNSRLIVLIHGFSRGYKEEWIRDITKELVKLPNTNVVAIDWGVQHSVGPIDLRENTRLYYSAFQHVEIVAEESANFLAHVIKSTIGHLDHLHLLGHSMGAHIAGQIADRLKKNHGIKVDRITGLDPALPCFRAASSNLSLRRSHADFVDVIHTNSLPQDDSTFGIYRSLGHVDIYPNGGNDQPDCPRWTAPVLPTLPWQPVFSFATRLATCDSIPDLGRNVVHNYEYLMCNHFKAPAYVLLSLKHKQCQLLAVPMEDKGQLANRSASDICKKAACVEMGMAADTYKRSPGRYYIDMANLDANCPK